MLRCCQPQSSPLFTNSLRSIDAGLLRGNDNINQSWRHNGPNQPEITGNVTMSYVCRAAAAGSNPPSYSLRPLDVPPPWKAPETRSVHPTGSFDCPPVERLNSNARLVIRISGPSGPDPSLGWNPPSPPSSYKYSNVRSTPLHGAPPLKS